MPLGASRLAFLAKTAEAAVARRTAATLTSNGAEIDTAQSKFGGSSMTFPVFPDTLYVDRSDLYDFGTDDFTIEFWVRVNGDSSAVYFNAQTSDFQNGWRISNFGTQLRIQFYSSGSATTIFSPSSIDFTDGSWHHCAIVRNSGTVTFYMDGTAGTGVSYSTAVNTVTNGDSHNLTIGYAFEQGYIDEIRFSTTARYTSSFTSPTSAFTNDADTLFLCHADGTDADTVFIDDNGDRAPNGVQAIGNAQIDTAQSNFGSSSAYFSTGEDSIRISDGIDNFGSTWTFECWFRAETLQDNNYLLHNNGIIWLGGPSRSTHSNEVILMIPASEGGGATYYTNFTAVSGGWQTNQWYHIAVVHDSGTTEVFVDGTSLGTASTNSVMFTDTTYLDIGKHRTTAGQDFNGWIDEIRISDTARYTSSFTPSTTAFENDANTLLLLHAEEGADGTTEIFDDNGGTLPSPPTANYRTDSNSSSLVLVAPFDYLNEFADVHADIKGSGSNITPTVGSNASITTTQRKWTSSPDYQKGYEGIATSGQSQTQWALGTSIPSSNSGSNTFVIEGWFYANSSETNRNWCISSSDSGGRFLFGINSGSTFSFGNENNIGIGSGWHHIAIVLDSGTKRFYYDGIYKGAWVSSNTGFSTLHLGQFNAGDNNDFRGHIQDFRIYVGTNNGYTGTNSSSANFTLPSSIIESYS